MRIRFIAAPTAVLMSLSIISGPAFAQDAEPIEPDAVEECPAPDLSGVPFADAAATAITAIDGLTGDDSTCPDLEEDRERAVEALKAAVARVPQGSVASAVLAALINGDSPAGIAAEHGTAMAKAAAERRDERAQGEGRPEAVETEVVDENAPEAPVAPVTPATPAVPATPPVADEAPATPAKPATPAQPVQPEIPVQSGRPTDG